MTSLGASVFVQALKIVPWAFASEGFKAEVYVTEDAALTPFVHH